MIYLHKLIPFFLSPLFVCIAIAVFGVLRHNRAFVALGLCLLWLSAMPVTGNYFVSVLEQGQVRRMPDETKPADAVVVLSGMITTVRSTTGYTSEWGDPDRFFGGIELIKANKAPRIIFTRGKVPWENSKQPEGEVLQRYALEMGVPAEKIALTEEVVNTAAEARATRKLFSQSAKPSIILVTSAFHMPRAAHLFRNEGFSVETYPVDIKTSTNSLTPMNFLPTPNGLAWTSVFVREMIGRTYYRLREFIR